MRIVIFYCFVLFSLNMVFVFANFRILAPEFICPKDNDSPIDKPDNTIITIQVPAGSELAFSWVVRWKPLQVVSQRFPLMLWKTVRDLEKKLNGPQMEKYVYVIEHSELLRGVEYIFNVTSISEDLETTSKEFQIDNSQGDQKLENVDGRGDMFSVLLLGGQETYSDLVYDLEAQVTMCSHTQDYFFKWAVKSDASKMEIDVSHVEGYKLEIPPHTLSPGETYDVSCQLMSKGTSMMVAQTGLLFKTLFRGLRIYLNVDVLIVSSNFPFAIESYIVNQDYYYQDASYEWACVYRAQPCDNFDSENNSILYLVGLPEIGEYKITVTARTMDEVANTSAKIIAVEPILPIIQIEPIPRLLNTGSFISVTANVSNVTPSCTMTWYFATEDQMMEEKDCSHEKLDDCSHGTAIAESVTILSLEENFLIELSDFSNETEWRQVSADAPTQAGRARIVAECGCSIMNGCMAEGVVYGELWFEVNDGPEVKDIKITPETGVALESVFRISTISAEDSEGPLRYTFYCSLNPDLHIQLGSLLEQLSVETTLPYVVGGVEIWLEACDSFGACSKSTPMKVKLSFGEARNIEFLLEDLKAHAVRCELEQMKKVAVFAVITFINAEQYKELSMLTEVLHDALQLDQCAGAESYRSQLIEIFNQIGLDTNTFSF